MPSEAKGREAEAELEAINNEKISTDANIWDSLPFTNFLGFTPTIMLKIVPCLLPSKWKIEYCGSSCRKTLVRVYICSNGDVGQLLCVQITLAEKLKMPLSRHHPRISWEGLEDKGDCVTASSPPFC